MSFNYSSFSSITSETCIHILKVFFLMNHLSSSNSAKSEYSKTCHLYTTTKTSYTLTNIFTSREPVSLEVAYIWPVLFFLVLKHTQQTMYHSQSNIHAIFIYVSKSQCTIIFTAYTNNLKDLLSPHLLHTTMRNHCFHSNRVYHLKQ